MRDGDIDDILKAAGDREAPDAELVARIANKLGDSAQPVRQLPHPWVVEVGLLFVWGLIGWGAAALLGIHGFPKLSSLEKVVIFPALSVLTWLAAMVCVGQMTPGSRRRIAPGLLVAGGTAALAIVFASLFHDHELGRFVPDGLVCLKAGVAVAVPAAIAGWLIVRRGFFVSPAAAGLILGALGGLAGITMLELHCPNLRMPHILVWHTAVLPVSGALGAAVGWALGGRHRKQSAQ